VEAAAPPEPSPAAPAPTPGGAIGVRWTPSQIPLKQGETGSLALAAIGARDLLAVDVVLSYDALTLQVVDITPGALLSLDGAPIQPDKQIEFGKAHAKFTRATGTTGAGAVVSVTVRALKPGLGLVTVDSVVMTTGAGDEQPYTPGQGRVLVTP
jgi:hypothetical protein